MATSHSPLCSYEAHGTLASLLEFRQHKGYCKIRSTRRITRTSSSFMQQRYRSFTSFCMRNWKLLSPSDQAAWSRIAADHNLLGIHQWLADTAYCYSQGRGPRQSPLLTWQQPIWSANPPIITPGPGQFTATISYRPPPPTHFGMLLQIIRNPEEIPLSKIGTKWIFLSPETTRIFSPWPPGAYIANARPLAINGAIGVQSPGVGFNVTA